MPALRQTVLYCGADGCHRSATFIGVGPAKARKWAKEVGWHYSKKRGDRCPEHPK